MTQTRRLAAILAADVAGYSRLIGADEEGTLDRLRSIRADVIDPKITEHRGRLVKKRPVMACSSNSRAWLLRYAVSARVQEDAAGKLELTFGSGRAEAQEHTRC
jgi:hypothetical protein